MTPQGRFMSNLDKKQRAKLIFAAVTFGLAVGALAWQFAGGGRGEPVDYFYDLSERELFTAPKDAVPPIRGVNDEIEDGVRAVVIALDGNPRTRDRSALKVAYLETNSPELKLMFTQRRDVMEQGGQGMAFDRNFVRAHTLVRAPDGDEWFSIMSDEGADIVAVIAEPGPDGKVPVICIP